MYGYICQHCGAHLDPGEKCDCEEEEEKENDEWGTMLYGHSGLICGIYPKGISAGSTYMVFDIGCSGAGNCI